MGLFTRKDGCVTAEASTRPVAIVVADDDPHDQMLFAMAARDCDPEPDVTFVEDGLALVAQLRRRAATGRLPDLVVVDLRMPRMNGHEVLAELAGDPDLRDVAAVMFSTSRRTRDIDQSMGLGALRHEVKPSTYEELVAFVQGSVDICVARREGDR